MLSLCHLGFDLRTKGKEGKSTPTDVAALPWSYATTGATCRSFVLQTQIFLFGVLPFLQVPWEALYSRLQTFPSMSCYSWMTVESTIPRPPVLPKGCYLIQSQVYIRTYPPLMLFPDMTFAVDWSLKNNCLSISIRESESYWFHFRQIVLQCWCVDSYKNDLSTKGCILVWSVWVCVWLSWAELDLKGSLSYEGSAGTDRVCVWLSWKELGLEWMNEHFMYGA